MHNFTLLKISSFIVLQTNKDCFKYHDILQPKLMLQVRKVRTLNTFITFYGSKDQTFCKLQTP